MARKQYLSLKLSDQEREEYQKVADHCGLSLGEWVRGACNHSLAQFRVYQEASKIGKILRGEETGK